MPFHRFQDPTYNPLGGAFPGTIGAQTYDRINVVSGGVGGGDGSANADGQRVGGVNAGTYFVAFNEDATSLAMNRGLRALSQNTDAIDNILRGSIPAVGRIIVTSTGVIDVPMSSEIFVGEFGLVPNSVVLNKLVHVENLDDTPVYVNGTFATANQPVVILIHDGTGTNVVGTAADGFLTGVVVRFAVPLPAGSYKAFVGVRTSYAQLFESKLTALVGEIIANRNYNTENWINFTQGLDEKYRRSTVPSQALRDTPGSGGTIERDGKALTVETIAHDWSTLNSVYDPLNAAFVAQLPNALGVPGFVSDYNHAYSGHTGFVFITNRRGSANAAEKTRAEQPLAALSVLNPLDIQATTIGTQTVRTFIPEGTAAVLNPTGTASNQAQITAPAYFRTGGQTAILCGFDALLITVGGVPQYYFVDSIVDDYTVTVTSPGGFLASFAASTTATIQWVQFSCCVGGAGQGMPGLDPSHHWGGFVWTDPMRLRAQASDWPLQGYQEDPPTYIASDSTKDVLRAYAFNPTDGSHDLGWHITAGGVFSPGSFVDIAPGASELGGAFFKTNQGLIPTVETLGNGYNIVTIDVWQASMVWMAVDPAATLEIAATLSVQTAATGGSNPNYLATTGDHIEVFLDTRPNTSQIILLQWNVLQFAFSEGDDQVPTGVAAVYRWTGTMGADGRFYMTRTDYNS
jgi:hypothetical protein